MTVEDPAGLAWYLRRRLLWLLGQELTEILSENKKSWLGKWILRREPRVALSNKIWDLGFSNEKQETPYRCIKKK